MQSDIHKTLSVPFLSLQSKKNEANAGPSVSGHEKEKRKEKKQLWEMREENIGQKEDRVSARHTKTSCSDGSQPLDRTTDIHPAQRCSHTQLVIDKHVQKGNLLNHQHNHKKKTC